MSAVVVDGETRPSSQSTQASQLLAVQRQCALLQYDRPLSETARHPGKLSLFCRASLTYLGAKDPGRPRTIILTPRSETDGFLALCWERFKSSSALSSFPFQCLTKHKTSSQQLDFANNVKIRSCSTSKLLQDALATSTTQQVTKIRALSLHLGLPWLEAGLPTTTVAIDLIALYPVQAEQ